MNENEQRLLIITCDILPVEVNGNVLIIYGNIHTRLSNMLGELPWQEYNCVFQCLILPRWLVSICGFATLQNVTCSVIISCEN